MAGKTYDQKCLDLAEYFLADVSLSNMPFHKDQLAALIQRTIEEYIDSEQRQLGEGRLVPHHGSGP